VVLFALATAAGTAAFHRLPTIPDSAWLIAEAGLIALIVASSGCRPAWRYRRIQFTAAAFLGGFVWSHGFALLEAPAMLPMPDGRLAVSVLGTVRGLPQKRGELTRFVLETSAMPSDPPIGVAKHRFRLTWRNAPSLAPGDIWRITVRLKAARGYASPGAWDYERWLYEQGIRYTGYVIDDEPASRVASARCCVIDRWRQAISLEIDRLDLSDFSRGVLRALVVADRSGLDARANALFQATGTSHLMAVSGLHIGLVSGGVMLMFGWIWRRLPTLCSRVPARIAAASAGVVAAAGYAALAGLGLPTQRALVMLVVFAGAVVFRRQSAAAHALALAAVAVLFWHPPSILDAGFWLSFGAVATILATLQWTVRRPPWFAAILVQLALTLALWPVLLGSGLPASAISPLVNLLVVPLFGILIVPWSLIGSLIAMLLPVLAAPLLWPLGQLLDWVSMGLALGERWAVFLPGLHPGALWLLVAAVCLILAPPGFPLRWAGVPLLALPWMPRPPVVAPGEFQLHLLDVGQGLSAVVETHRHVLVYDTGPVFSGGFSTADAVVLPFLAQRGHRHVDHLMISHGDNDHGGGLGVMRKRIPIVRVSSGEPERTGLADRPCAVGQHWRWDGVDFSVLNPDPAAPAKGNNASCVLRVENKAGVLLLTGDIEAAVERRLVSSSAALLDAAVVVAPHHGSRSSSTAEFIDAVSAEHVLFAAGWANRYGFPAPEVVARWTEDGASTHETTGAGTLRFRFSGDGEVRGPDGYRIRAQRFWSARSDAYDAGSAGQGHAVSSAD
jgi:competence protein ComEC